MLGPTNDSDTVRACINHIQTLLELNAVALKRQDHVQMCRHFFEYILHVRHRLWPLTPAPMPKDVNASALLRMRTTAQNKLIELSNGLGKDWARDMYQRLFDVSMPSVTAAQAKRLCRVKVNKSDSNPTVRKTVQTRSRRTSVAPHRLDL
jgi:hypothetical protein